jgi:AcrR family transcriptional regulator
MSRGHRHGHEQRLRRIVTRREIVEAALAIADDHGLEEVSMRNVAHRLGVGTMTLYHYVRGKDELLTAMSDAVAAQLVVPGELPGHWRDALLAISERTRDAFLRHEWLVDNIGNRPIATPNWLRHVEQSAAAVETFTDDPELAFRLVVASDEYTMGYAVREISQRRWRGAIEDRFRLTPELEELLASGEFPRVKRFFDEGPTIERPADAFAFGLQRLFDGFEPFATRSPG